MPTNQASEQHQSTFRLSNLQVATILFVLGICLISVTWVFAKDLGRVPVSLWEICTAPAPSQDTSTPSALPAAADSGR